MEKHEIKDMLIISNYDFGYCRTIMLKGKILTHHSAEMRHINNIFRGCLSDTKIEKLQEHYKCDVLVCEDGCIDFYPYEMI